jgi:hypothetical protein
LVRISKPATCNHTSIKSSQTKPKKKFGKKQKPTTTAHTLNINSLTMSEFANENAGSEPVTEPLPDEIASMFDLKQKKKKKKKKVCHFLLNFLCETTHTLY